MNKGVSLVEILVVIAVFAILGIVTTQAVLLTLRGTKKSEAVIKVRENLNYAMAVMERQLRNSEEITSTCPGGGLSINYRDERGAAASFSCVNVGPSAGYVASGSAQLTSTDITVTSCSFSCTTGTSSNPPSVTISLTGKGASDTGVTGAEVSVETKIFLRTY